MITKQSKITANKKPKQSIATGTPLARSPEVCPKAALAQPLSSAEFLGELEQQRTQRSREDREKLTEAIMAVGAARASTDAPGSQGAHENIKLGIDVHLDRYVKGSVHEIVTFFTRSLKQGVRP